MSKSASTLLFLLIATLIGLSVFSFFQIFEKKEKVIHRGYTGEALSNPYYASRLFLKRMGVPTLTRKPSQSILTLPDTNTLLFISTRRTNLSPEHNDRLIKWVKSGGHLVTRATHNWKYYGEEYDDEYEPDELESIKTDEGSEKDKLLESPDPLQRFMGVTTDVTTEIEYDETEEDKKFPFINGYKSDKEKSFIKIHGNPKKLALDLEWFIPIKVDSKHQKQTESIKLGDKNFIIRQQVGKGAITLVSNFEFILNETIELEDHAEILWQLVQPLQSQYKSNTYPAKIWLVHNDKTPYFMSLLWNKYWAFILSLTFLLLAWLIMHSRRFGPLIPKEEENRRSLKEHITSSGNYYWKNNNKQKLIDSSRKALTQQLARANPGWSQLSREEQILLLSEQTQMKTLSVDKILFNNSSTQADDFTHLIRQLEKIRKSI